ncbi:MAG: hypothetical protein ACRETY_04805 [Steroidobacteraceae bacterium]
MLLLAFVNVAAWRASTSDPYLCYGVIAANLAMSIFGLFAVRAVPEPQAYAVLAAFLGLLIASVARARLKRTDDERHDLAT